MIIVLLFDVFNTTLAGGDAVLITVLLGHPYELGLLVAIGAGVVPVEVVPDPELELAPQAVSMKASAVASESINQSEFRLPICTMRIFFSPYPLRSNAYFLESLSTSFHSDRKFVNAIFLSECIFKNNKII